MFAHLSELINYIRLNRYWLAIIGVVNIVWVFVASRLDYPPSFEQIEIGMPVLWQRILCFLIVYMGALFFSSKIMHLGKWFSLVVASSPFVFGLWYLHPVESIKFCVGLLLLSKLFDSKHKSLWVIGFCILVVVVNYLQSSSKAKMFYLFNNERLTAEVNLRFLAEDDLTYKVDLPNVVRRIAYNKISFLTRDILKEVTSYWNIEDVFFQEMHPGSKKSLVLMLWPTLILFFLGVANIDLFRKGRLLSLLFATLIVGYVNFLSSGANDNTRYTLSLPFLGLLISGGMIVARRYLWVSVLVLSLTFYGWQLGIQDLLIRPDYWLDNRPIVYQKVYEAILKTNYISGKYVVTDLMGRSKDYCKYYIGNVCDKNFSFGGFPNQVKNEKFVDDTVYAGFIGEFLGSDFNNYFSNDFENKILGMGFEKYSLAKIRDSVAYRYGDAIFVGVKK